MIVISAVFAPFLHLCAARWFRFCSALRIRNRRNLFPRAKVAGTNSEEIAGIGSSTSRISNSMDASLEGRRELRPERFEGNAATEAANKPEAFSDFSRHTNDEMDACRGMHTSASLKIHTHGCVDMVSDRSDTRRRMQLILFLERGELLQKFCRKTKFRRTLFL